MFHHKTLESDNDKTFLYSCVNEVQPKGRGFYPAVRTMEQGGLLYPLNELADQHDPYFYKVAYKSILNWFTRDVGNLYGWPNFSSPEELMKDGEHVAENQLFLVRGDMYKAIGSPDMRTPDGFINALKAAKEMFPEVNGKPLLPFGGHPFSDRGSWGFDGYLQDFLAIPMEKDGNIYDHRSDPEYLGWLKTLRKANEMGLIPKDIFIDIDTLTSEKIAQGRYFSLLHQNLGTKQHKLIKKKPEAAYIAINAMFNSKLEQPVLAAANVINGWLMNFITRNNKDPERTIKFFSYLISDEGQTDCSLGKEGVTWTTQEGGDFLTPEMLSNN